MSGGDVHNTHQCHSEPSQPNTLLCPSCPTIQQQNHKLCVVETDSKRLLHLNKLVHVSGEEYITVN